MLFFVINSPAIDTHVNDVSLPEEYFEQLSGLDHFYIPKLGPYSFHKQLETLKLSFLTSY